MASPRSQRRGHRARLPNLGRLSRRHAKLAPSPWNRSKWTRRGQPRAPAARSSRAAPPISVRLARWHAIPKQGRIGAGELDISAVVARSPKGPTWRTRERGRPPFSWIAVPPGSSPPGAHAMTACHILPRGPASNDSGPQNWLQAFGIAQNGLEVGGPDAPAARSSRAAPPIAVGCRAGPQNWLQAFGIAQNGLGEDQPETLAPPSSRRPSGRRAGGADSWERCAPYVPSMAASSFGLPTIAASMSNAQVAI